MLLNKQSITFISVGILLLMTVGCMTGYIKNKTEVSHPDGTVVTSKIKICLPKYPASSTIYTNTHGEYVNLPASQDEATIEDVKQDGRNTRILYIGAMILVILGGLGLALPNNLLSNKDALLILGSGLVSFGVIRFVQASEPIMGYILPLIILGGIVYMAYNYIKNKNST